MDELKRLWQEHERRPFPTGHRAKEVCGVNLTVLQSEIAGCLFTAAETGGVVGQRLRQALADNRRKLAKIIPELDEKARPYFENLGRIAKILEETIQPA